MALFGVSHSDAPEASQRLPSTKIHIDAEELRNYVSSQTIYRNRVDATFERPLTIFYENIKEGFAEILRALQVDVVPMVERLEKLNATPLSEMVENYSEVKNFDIR